MLKRLKDFTIGMLIGSLLFGIIPTIANTIKTFVAEEATFPILVDGQEVKLDMPAVTIDGRTYLPLRTLGNILGVKVDWNDEKRQAEIIKEGAKMQNTQIHASDIEYTYVVIDDKEYINVIDIHNICDKKGYIFSWQINKKRDNDKLWYTLIKSDDSVLSREELLKKIGISEEETKGLETEDLKRKYGLAIERDDILELFPEQSEFPYMTKEEFETIVLPFINK